MRELWFKWKDSFTKVTDVYKHIATAIDSPNKGRKKMDASGIGKMIRKMKVTGQLVRKAGQLSDNAERETIQSK